MKYEDEKELQRIIKKIRIYINDPNSEQFTDEEIKVFIDEACCIWIAIADLWDLKSVKLDLENGSKKYTVGKESYESNSLKDIIAVYSDNAEKFRSKCECGNGDIDSGVIISSSLNSEGDFYSWLE